MSPNNIAKLRSVPTPIRDWFDSFELVDIIFDLEAKFGLPADEMVISSLLFQLEVRDLSLDKFQDKLASGLSLSPLVARELFEEIKVRALLPIASELNTWGVSGLTVTPAAATPVPQAATPTSNNPFSTPLTSFSIPTSSPSAAPSVQAAPAPTPVSIYKDAIASQSAISPSRTGFMGGTAGSGDISGTVNLAPPQMRAARVDLGVRTPDQMDDALKSLYVQRETPKIQAIDYGTPKTPTPVTAEIPSAPISLVSAPTPVPSNESSPVTFTPQPEIVSVPTSAAPVEAPQGFIDSIMRRIAPWHYAKFGARKDRPSEALAEEIPSATINYSEKIPEAPQAATPTPLPADKLPAPPTPLA